MSVNETAEPTQTGGALKAASGPVVGETRTVSDAVHPPLDAVTMYVPGPTFWFAEVEPLFHW